MKHIKEVIQPIVENIAVKSGIKTRSIILTELISKYHWQKLWDRLSGAEQDTVYEFIYLHNSLDKGQFEHALNRRVLDKSHLRTKNWTIVDEILCNVNTHYGE